MSARNLVVKTAEWCGVFVLVVAALPLVALAGFLARGVAVVATVTWLVGLLLLCGLNAGFRARVGRALGLIAPADAARRPHIRT